MRHAGVSCRVTSCKRPVGTAPGTLCAAQHWIAVNEQVAYGIHGRSLLATQSCADEQRRIPDKAGFPFAAGAVLWTVANELLLQPREYTAFSLALDRLRDDPRVMVALGSPVSGYGQETRNRAARQRIPHRVYTDDRGVEHVQVRVHC